MKKYGIVIRCTSSFFLVLLAFIGLVSTSYGFTQIQEKKTISIMTYNVENLFDATDDAENQKDMSYLPMKIKEQWNKNYCANKRGFYFKLCNELDWTQEKYEKKLSQIAKVLLDFNNKKGADIILLEELENATVINDLWSKYLKSHGFLKPIHFESGGHRGMDVGIITRFPVKKAIAHKVDLSDMNKSTRDILEARLLIKPDLELRVAANHWPSLGNKTKTRMRAAEVIKKIANEAHADGVSFIALGDFNTPDYEKPNPIDNNLSNGDARSPDFPLVDVHHFLERVTQFPDGTHYYKGKWNHLDRVLASKDLFSKHNPIQINPFSFKIITNDYLFRKSNGKKGQKIPHRYNFFSDKGFSDHLPLTIKLILK